MHRLPQRMERGLGEVLDRYCGSQNEATLRKQAPKDRPCIHAAGVLQLNAYRRSEVLTFTARKFGE